MAISKELKSDNIESHNSLNLKFTNVRSFRCNFVSYEYFLEPDPPDIIALCDTNLEHSFVCINFSVRDCFP